MSLRVVAAGFVVIAASSSARAQAPGDYYGESTPQPQPTLAPPSYVPPTPYVVAPPARESVMAHRFGVGLSIGNFSIAPQDTPDAKTQFGVGELSLRFRATPHFELELAMGGGREQLKDGTQGDNEMKMGLLAARYVFNPEAPWNLSIMGGLGGFQVAPHGSTDQQFQDSERPLGELGIGIERRWHQFALRAELRAVHVGAPKNEPAAMPTAGTFSGGGAPPSTSGTSPMQPPPPQPTPPTSAPSDQLSGGMLTIGASYYF
jgi:hypothetical protein